MTSRELTQRTLPLVQFAAAPGAIDLAWGHPDPQLLPVDALKAAAVRVFDRYGQDALNYGYAAGPGPLISWLQERIPLIDARRPQADEILISAGTSQALDLVSTLFSKPGDVVLVESPSYHLAVRIFRDHPLELVPVATDADGLRVQDVERTVRGLRKDGRRIAFLYTIPTFHNPTSALLPIDRRRLLVDLAQSEQLVIVEDDAYRELTYDGPAPPSLWSLDRARLVIRLGSFAKSLAPGLRSGFVTADSAVVSRIVDSGVLDSGGGISHFPSLLIAEFAQTGEYARNVEHLRDAYRARRDALLGALAEHLQDRASWQTPHGGYFAWLTLPGGTSVADLMKAAVAEGTAFMPGSAFYLQQPPTPAIRLSFSRYASDQLVEAAARLGRAFRTVG